MNDKELQKIIDTKNGTISVLKDTVKKWVREYNMLDACIELQNEKINAYKMSENEANVIIAELEAYKDVNEDFKTAWEELKAENERLKKAIEYDSIYNDMQAEIDCGEKMIEKYQKCLQEIKAIAEADVHIVGDEKLYYYSIEKILQVLTKVEEV